MYELQPLDYLGYEACFQGHSSLQQYCFLVCGGFAGSVKTGG